MYQDSPRSLPWVTIAIIIVNVGVFAAEVATGAGVSHASPETLLALGADDPLRTLHGEWWRNLASMFLHNGYAHLLGNMMFLWMLAPAERDYGHGAFAAIYLLAGLGSCVVHGSYGQVPAVGSSGAVFGVAGAYAIVAWHHRRDAKRPTRVWLAMAAVVVITFVSGLFDPTIAQGMHAGGFVTGLALGALLFVRPDGLPSPRRSLTVASIGFAAIVAAMVGLAAVRPPRCRNAWPSAPARSPATGGADAIFCAQRSAASA